MLNIILDDLKKTFGNKILLSPEDIAEIISTTVGQQANQRSDNRFPIPYNKDDFGRIKISIYDLAEYISNIGKKHVKHQFKMETEKATDKPTRIQKKASKGHLSGQWWALHKQPIISIINKSILDFELNYDTNKKDKDIIKN